MPWGQRHTTMWAASVLTVSFKALIMKIAYTSDFFMGIVFYELPDDLNQKQNRLYVQIFEKI